MHILMLTKPVTIGDLLVPKVAPLSPEWEIFSGLGTSKEKMFANTLTLISVRWDKVRTTGLGKPRIITWDCTETQEIPTFHRAQRIEIQFIFERRYPIKNKQAHKNQKPLKINFSKKKNFLGKVSCTLVIWMRVVWRKVCCQLLIVYGADGNTGWASALAVFISIHTIHWPPPCTKDIFWGC